MARGRTLLIAGGVIALLLLLVGVVAAHVERRLDVPPYALEIVAKHRLDAQGPQPGTDMATGDIRSVTMELERRVGFPMHAPDSLGAAQRLIGGRASSLAATSAASLLDEGHGRSLSLFVTRPLADAHSRAQNK